GSLDRALDRLAEVVGLRLGADCVVIGVQRRGKGVAWWPLEGDRSPGRWEYPMWQQDEAFLERVRDEGPSICRDTRELADPTPGQRAAMAAGVRSSLRMPLTDEQGRPFGFVLACSLRPEAFDEGDLRELLDLGREAGGMLRMRLLLERLHFEHALRTAEADLLARVAEAEEEGALLEAVAEGVAQALGADMAAVAVDAGASGMRMLRTWPQGLIRAGDWAAAEAAVDAPENARMLERGGSWVREDLAVDDALPVEVFLRDRLGARSLAAAVRSRRWGGLGLALGAMRREPGSWHSVEREFLVKVARVVEIGVERLRRGELAVAHALSLEQQAELLGVGSELLETLWQAEDQASAAQAIAERLREFFGADHVALGTVDLVRRRREVLGLSSAVMRAADLGPWLEEADVAAYTEALGRLGGPAGDVFAQRPANPGAAIGWDRGLRSGMRVPFRLSDGTVGLVTVGSRQPGRYTREDEERLIELSRPMAVALDRVRLLAKMAETSELLAAKTRVLLAMTPGASIDAVGDVFVREVRRMFGATHALVLAQTPAGALSLRASTEHFTEEELAEAARRAEANGTWRAAMAAGPQLMEDAAVLDDHASRVLAGHGLRSALRAPIRDGAGQVCGVATVARSEPGAWDDSDLAQLSELAGTLGLVLERAALLEAADAQARRAAAVLEVLGALGPGETLEAVAGRVATALRGMYGADHCAIGVVEGQRVRLAAIDSVVGPWSVGERRTVGEVFDAWPPGPVVHVFEDLQRAEAVTETTRVLRERGLRSSMRVAVSAGGEVCGVV
ncbi:GAF domain-containing protein, partial [Tepidiforma sp.]|uniref:GAF domain-containing protein n=1 Tax=Tepidiforma sp. TaxID=2682230 RepID=UPI002ADE08E1